MFGTGLFAPIYQRLFARHPFKVVSFFTTDAHYTQHAKRLISTLERFGIRFEVDPIEPEGVWEHNCAKKADFVRRKWEKSNCPIVWLDADATVEQYPGLFENSPADFGVHRWQDREYSSGTLYFGKTDRAKALIDAWCKQCRSDPDTWDQVHLETAVHEIQSRLSINVLSLPRSYLQIFDQREDEPPVIKHWQASRLVKENGRSITPWPGRAHSPLVWSAY